MIADGRMRGLSFRAAALLEAAAAHLQRGDASAAAAPLSGARSLAPDHPEVLRLFAIGCVINGTPAEAVACLRRAILLQPDDALLHNNLGSALNAQGAADQASIEFTQATRLDPALAAAWYNLGKLLKSQAHTSEACKALARAVELEPQHWQACVAHADTLKALGSIDDAALAYRATLVHKPDAAHAWWGLANLKTRPFDAADTRQLEQRFAETTAAGDEAACVIGFALAKALEDEFRHEEAFDVLERANRQRRAQQPWDARAFSRYCDGLATASVTRSTTIDSRRGDEVIFILGLPRSGSTLVEQIISAHSEVEGAGELDDLPAVIDEECRRRGRDLREWMADASEADWQRLGERYLERTARWRQRKPRFSDKALDNWRYVGAAARMLPGARFVDCRRDPVETALSCYRQWFHHGQAFSYSLSDIASYAGDHARLMRTWHLRFPGRLRSQSLESLQTDLARVLPELLAFCRLDVEQACVDFFCAQRPVRTASAAQVRQPMQRDTTRAHLFGRRLDSLRRDLERNLAE